MNATSLDQLYGFISVSQRQRAQITYVFLFWSDSFTSVKWCQTHLRWAKKWNPWIGWGPVWANLGFWSLVTKQIKLCFFFQPVFSSVFVKTVRDIVYASSLHCSWTLGILKWTLENAADPVLAWNLLVCVVQNETQTPMFITESYESQMNQSQKSLQLGSHTFMISPLPVAIASSDHW